LTSDSFYILVLLAELERLLGTAKSKSRRDLIENALSTLDQNQRNALNSQYRPQQTVHVSALHPASHTQLYGIQRVSMIDIYTQISAFVRAF